MRRENNQRMSSGKGENLKISNSRAMGVIILIALLFVFQVVTFVVQKTRGTVVQQSRDVVVPQAGGISLDSSGAVGDVPAAGQVCRFVFNPNTITADSLQLLGFSPRQAATIVKYRTKGGIFRVKKDFAKMYVVDSLLYAQLAPYILLPDTLSGKKRHSGTGAGVYGGGSLYSSSAGRKNVQETAGSSTNFGGGRKNVQEMAESSTKENVGAGLHVQAVQQTSGVQGRSMASGGEGNSGVYGGKVGRNRFVCNLNRADSAELVMLYGIGGYYAVKILQYRERLGGSFVDARQLLEIEGFGQERFEKIQGSIVVLEKDVQKFSLLDAQKEFLERHPYIGPYAARGILTYIRVKGRSKFQSNFQLLQELVEEHVITENNALRIREYLLHL